MSGILDMVTSAIGQGSVSQLSSQLGTDPGKTQTAVSAALPMIFGAMSKHAQTDSGAQQIHSAVTSNTAPPAGPEPAPAAQTTDSGLLSSILGPHQDQVQQGVAKASGLDMHQAGKILMYLAPIVIGIIARKRQDDPQTTQQPGGLSGMLGEAARAAESQMGSGGGLGGMLGGLFK